MSAFHSEAAIARQISHVRKVPEAEMGSVYLAFAGRLTHSNNQSRCVVHGRRNGIALAN
jgi:hypothetical protein